jgi:DNA-binding NarL/FixJ family response regulator
VHERDAELISALLQGDRLRDAARQLHVSERTVRNHRDEMVRRLRDELAA